MKLLHSSQSAYTGQNGVSPQRRLPVDDGVTANAQSVSGEAIQFFYYAANGTLTQDAGQAAGTIVVANLVNKNVLNALGDGVGNFGDTSFSFGTGTILTQPRPFRALLAESAELAGDLALQAAQNRAIAVTEGFQNGWYTIDHEHGVIYGVKATTGTSDTGSYKVLVAGGGGSVSENVNIAKVGGTATVNGGVAGSLGVGGNLADGTTNTSNPVLTGGEAQDPTALPVATTAGKIVRFLTDLSRRMIVTLGTTIAGEDLAKDVLKTEQRFTGGRATADALIATGAGFLHCVRISPLTATPTAGLLTVYDNTAGSGTVLYSTWFKATSEPVGIPMNISFGTGLYVEFDGTLANVAVGLSYRQ